MDADEQEARVAAAFRAAAADPPPPGFDAGDIVATSRRITRRRRSAVAGAALAVLAVAGIGVTAGLSGGGGSTLTTASAGGDSEAARAVAPEAGAAGGARSSDAGSSAGQEAAAPVAPPAGAPGGGLDAGLASAGPPLGPGTGECADRQDPALRAVVEQVLPEVVGAPEAATTMECRPGGERGLALEVRDGTAAGLLSVTYLPPGTAPRPAPGVLSAPTASGGTVLVWSDAGRLGDPAPFAARLDAVVAYLAPRL